MRQMHTRRTVVPWSLAVAFLVAAPAVTDPWPGQDIAVTSAQDSPPRIDYLSFAQGAVPLSIGGPGAELGPNTEHQVRIVDGDPTPFSFITITVMDVITEFTYELPAPTTFDRLAVPHVLEVPGPSQTFTRQVDVLGSSSGPDDGFVLLASGTLEVHRARGQETELAITARPAVRWVKIRLQGGINVLRDRMGFDFSEIIGNGVQEPRPLASSFTGAWDSRFVKMELLQDGPLVSGCYDSQGLLEGVVDGNILRARGVNQGRDQVVSLFVLSVLGDGTLTGVHSTNGGPFRLYTGGPVDDVATLDCLMPPPPPGCGSVVYGINFDFDSAQIRSESEAVLASLYQGLAADTSASVAIRGHTSSEGSEAYNLELSQKRAQSVVDDLARRGLAANRLSAVGVGEAEPIASNNDEAGRSLNRRVDVVCT
jgi:hypothetical protein